MKKVTKWMMAAILICGATVVFSMYACTEARAQDDNPVQQVVSTELIRTDKSWDGVELPDYL